MKDIINVVKMAANFKGQTRIQALLKAQAMIAKELKTAQLELKKSKRKL